MTTGQPPLVSIVTPTYNSARYLAELLRSVETQDYPAIEHIVIDDGSQDDGATVALLRDHAGVRWWSRENRGQYPTLNEGFRAATGEFVTTISADDRYVDPGAIAAMARFLTEHPACDVVYGYTQHTDEAGRVLPVQPYQRYPPWMVKYKLGCFLHCSVLVRRERVTRDNLFFDESFRFTGDADWMVRLFISGCNFSRIDRFIGAYRHHELQVTTTATSDAAASARRRQEHERIHSLYGTSRMLTRLIAAYDTFQQRRVKAVGAWRHGGPRQLWTLASQWLQRKGSRD